MNPAPAARTIELPRLPPSIPRAGVSEVARLALRQFLGDADRRIAEAFRGGLPVGDALRARSAMVESVVTHVFCASLGEAPGLALYAVGGFGRGELFPHSDVDLLALCEASPSAAVGRALEAFFTCLWDIGLKPGHALRTVQECRSLAAADATIYTTLLDARRIAGGATALDAQLATITTDPTIWPPQEYFAAKREERQSRYARFDDTAYNLEPNLKDAPGGLRALHLVAWLGRRLFAAPSVSALVQRGLVAAAEASKAQRSAENIARIRFALHLAAGRSEERLLFDYQRVLANQFGFVDEHNQNLAVEQFMQGYYRAAMTLERFCEQFIQRAEEALDDHDDGRTLRLSLDFAATGGRLDCDPPDLLLHRPAAIIDLFRIWTEHPEAKALSADFAQRLGEALEHHGASLTTNPDVNAAFLRLLRKGAPAVEALARMNRHGVLARFIPAFARVVGRMQYDLFHVYTVDEHTIRVLRNVARCADREASRDYAHAFELWERLAKPELLLIAALFHDIAKGRGGDHSELGEAEAREFCMRLGLPDADTDLVAWLVRRHLLMSITAQRQDITDPGVVHRFAAEVADWERLDLLYLLTVADISGTSAKLWNSWKDRLLSDLYISARYVLRAGLDAPPHAADRVRECRDQARLLLAEQGIDAAAVERVWEYFPEQCFLRFSAAQIAWQTAGIARAADPGAPLVLVDPHGPRGGSEVFVYAPDRDGLFAVATAVLDRMRLSVHDARIVTARNGMSLDSFLVLDVDGGALADASRIERLRRNMIEILSRNPYRAEAPVHAPARSLRHFHIPPRIAFDAGSDGRTQLALVCGDRPGLLASVAQTLREHGVRVHDARIATFGERVEDFFLLSDEADRPLTAAKCETLHAALLGRLDDSVPKEQHASA